MLLLTGQDVIKAFSTLVLLFFFTICPVFAQDSLMLFKKIQLSKKSYTFDELTHQIQKQTGITFSYNASKINSQQHFRIKSDEMNVTQLLALVKKKSGISYKMINPSYIVYIAPINSNPSVKQKKKPKKRVGETVPKKEKKSNIAPIQSPVNSLASDSATQQTEVVIGDSIAVANYYSSGGAGYNGYGSNSSNDKSIHIVMRYPRAKDQVIVDPYASLNQPTEKNYFQLFSFGNPDISKFFEKNILIAGGFSADETYYFNPGIHFGFRFLYANLSYNIGAFSEWRYGIGTQVPLSETWFLQAELNTGKEFFKSFNYPTFDTTFFPPQDSLPPLIVQHDLPLNVVSKLSSFSISISNSLNKNLCLSGGISINRLRSSYFSDGISYDIQSINPPIPDVTSRFQTLKPLYVLSQSYNASDAIGVKYWVGVRLSVYWRFN